MSNLSVSSVRWWTGAGLVWAASSLALSISCTQNDTAAAAQPDGGTASREDAPPGPATPSDEAGGREPDASSPAPPPACARPAQNPCAPSPQCGCGADQTCDVVDDQRVACITATGVAGAGMACDGTTACVAGLTCDFGVCRSYCSNPRSACPLDSRSGAADAGAGACLVLELSDGGGRDLGTCVSPCDLVDPSTCRAGTRCNLFDDGVGGLLSGCSGATGSGAVGASCQANADCAPNLYCNGPATGPGASTCGKLCRVAHSPSDCETGSCIEFSPKVVVAGVEYGDCQ